MLIVIVHVFYVLFYHITKVFNLLLNKLLFAALCGAVVYNYLKMRDARSSLLPPETIPNKSVKVIFQIILIISLTGVHVQYVCSFT